LGSLAAVAYRSALALPWDIPAATEGAARQGITEAVAAARELPGSAAASVLDAARTAFVSAVSTVAGVGTVVFLGLAVVVAVAFRNVPTTADSPDPAELDYVSSNDSR
jgi:DHA2 family multidrug resistance protein-like MFS transporter